MDEENKPPVAPVAPPEPEEIPVTDNTSPEPAPTPEPTEEPQPSKEEVISEIREKAKDSEVEEITTDLDGEKADLVERAESESAVEIGVKPVEFGEKMKKPSKAPRIVLIVVLILLLSVVSIFLFAPDLISNLFSSSTSPTPQTSQTTTEEKENTSKLKLTGNSLSDFDLNFLSLETNKNIIYSPLSLKYALAMLKDASAGNSQSQIEAVIGDYQPKVYLNSENRSLANGMFINEDYSSHIKSSYVDTLKSKYNAEVAYDSFSTPAIVNSWISEKTLGIINNMLTENEVNPETKFLLINALAIDMEWKQKIQSDSKPYSVGYRHEKYDRSYIPIFDSESTKKAAAIGADINRYDIINELGEDKIRETVTEEYKKWLAEVQASDDYKKYPDNYNLDFNIDAYVKELSENYETHSNSTDFYFNNTETEKIFAKDLKEYDGSTLEYVGIMPKTESLSDYLKTFNAQKATSLIDSLKDASSLDSFKDGVVTKLTGTIPFFKFDYSFKLAEPLMKLGISDVFNPETADLSNMITDIDFDVENRPFINIALHKADIEFSNDGIKAAAVTVFGGMGATGENKFDYEFDVPVEEIDLTFDQPFLFLIRDKSTGEIWFAGTVSEV